MLEPVVLLQPLKMLLAFLGNLVERGTGDLVNRLTHLADTVENFKNALRANDQSKMIQLKEEFDTQLEFFVKRLFKGLENEYDERLTKRLFGLSDAEGGYAFDHPPVYDDLAYSRREQLEKELDQVLGTLDGVIKALKPARPPRARKPVKMAKASKSKSKKPKDK